jgi:hypothetical protein
MVSRSPWSSGFRVPGSGFVFWFRFDPVSMGWELELELELEREREREPRTRNEPRT